MASKNYPACLTEVLKHEGGYFNHAKDPGGETMRGITHAVARRNGYQGSMKSIPMDLVRSIYKSDYWDKVRGDRLPQGVDLAVFDFGVNSGPSRALKYFNALPAGLTPAAAVKALCAKRIAFVRALKTWQYFGKGWGRRIASVEAVGVRMTGATGKELQDEAAGAKKKRNADVAKGGGAAGGGAVLPPPDAFDWYAFLYGALTVAAVGAVIYFGLKAYHNQERLKAYLGEAKEWLRRQKFPI